ncbi:MAG TPA: O-antigen ligase family protein [Anaerolineae bacterium]|nr:O-antigen ligase family protein [Anaerolineae bacterium]
MTERWRRPAVQLAAEWVIVVLAAPFLLLPSLRWQVTVIMLGVLCLFWLLSLASGNPWPVTPFNGPLCLFTVMLAVGILVTSQPDLTLAKALGLVLGLALFRALAQLRGKVGMSVALAGLLLAGMGVWAIGLMDLHWPTKVPIVQVLLDRLPQRVAQLPGSPAGGVSPNQLAGTLALLLPVAIVVIAGGGVLGKWRRMLRCLAVVAVVLWAVTLFLTQSRGGWVGAAAGTVVLFALWGVTGRRRWQRVSGWMLPVVLASLTVAVIGVLGVNQVGEVLCGAAEGSVQTAVGSISLQGRVEVWSRALTALRDFPFTGLGLGSFRRAAATLYPFFLLGSVQDISHSHNVFLQVGVDVGLPGLVGYLGLLATAVAVGWGKVRRGGWERWVGLGVLSGLLGYHVFGLADTVALGSKPSFLFWWVLGLLAVEPDP